jgi:predicted O-linked N-acetylglucosamine transferase (SPINDLY family)
VLDTSPYGAHTTASDALWAGVPVITRPSATFASRVAGSLLQAVGLPELIVGNDEDYFNLALTLARDPGKAAALRLKLAGNRATAPLFDAPAYTLALEDLFRQMEARRRANLQPAEIGARAHVSSRSLS